MKNVFKAALLLCIPHLVLTCSQHRDVLAVDGRLANHSPMHMRKTNTCLLALATGASLRRKSIWHNLRFV